MDLDAAIQAAVNHRRLNPRQIQLSAIAGSIGAYVCRKNFHLIWAGTERFPKQYSVRGHR
jgi:hypothetical protein